MFLLFTIRGRAFAISSRSVKEIAEFRDNVKKVFKGGVGVKGLMSFEEEIISVLDTPYLLGIGERGAEPFILVCRDKSMDRPAGITVSGVKGMAHLEPSNIKPLEKKEEEYAAGYTREGNNGSGRVVTIIDAVKFFDYAYNKIKKERRPAAALR